jgi:glutaconate CoA-transferase subunit B
MMAVAIAREVRDGERVATGANSPIPASGCLLAQHLHAPATRVIILGSNTHYPFTSGKEFFDFAQRGLLDLFFLGGIQIDGSANINLHVLGDYYRPERRFPGAFGSGVLYYVAKRVILFRAEHSRRVFVPRVDFITASGHTPDYPQRSGGPSNVVTPLAVLDFSRSAGAYRLRPARPHSRAFNRTAKRRGAAPAPRPRARGAARRLSRLRRRKRTGGQPARLTIAVPLRPNAAVCYSGRRSRAARSRSAVSQEI